MFDCKKEDVRESGYDDIKAHWYCLQCNPLEACRLMCPLQSGEPRYCPADRRLANWKWLKPGEDWPTDYTDHSKWVCEKCSYKLPCMLIIHRDKGRPRCCPGTRDPVVWDVDTGSEQSRLPIYQPAQSASFGGRRAGR